jgi:hypothetical protein
MSARRDDQPSTAMATDRAAVQAGCRWIAGGRRGDRQCGGLGWGRGSLIHHAATRAVAPLVVAMVEAPFDALLMPTPRRAHRGVTRGLATRGRAVHVAAITAAANRKELTAAGTRTKAKRVVHGAARRCCHWTPVPIRGTKKATVLVPWSPRRSRGPGVPALGPHLGAAPQRTSAGLRPPTPTPLLIDLGCRVQGGAPRRLRRLGAVSGRTKSRRLPHRSHFRITRFQTLADT